MTINIITELKNTEIITLQQKIIELKKEIILMRIKKNTQQNIKTHLIKDKQHLLAQMLTVETLKLNK
uniref:Ribosomal protein L29 n=1 Tax=Antithamnionella ternifolia TaxID=207919 RepID=A0A4D6WNL7_9FLOR|nr:ribosomal protein L29 [Antithamnionella ternifolia]